MPRIVRKPSHAGSWYEDDASTLSRKVATWLANAHADEGQHARALIGPHAGFRYCGHVMAHAYKQVDPDKVLRVFVLGPSHHVYTRKCVLSSATHYSSPIGEMAIDIAVYDELQSSGMFEAMDLDVDEAEHSLELHLPFIMAVLRQKPVKIVPIMVGALTPESEARYGVLMAHYLDDPSNLFVVSSDFCHWGTRFNYTFFDETQGPIHKSIEWLDRTGMRVIESGNPRSFTSYLKQYNNTICGRHPIGVFLNMLQHCKTRHKIEFRNYDQSSRCVSLRDSSVSYAAGVVTIMD